MNKKYCITKKFLIEEYSKKENPAKIIAEMFGCDCGTIYQKLKKYDISIRNPGRKYNSERHKKHYCQDCNKEINWQAIRCHKCANILINESKKIHKFCIDCNKK